MKDALFYDLALDWRRPYCKIKFRGEENYVWGQFSMIDVSSSHPTKAQFDAYTADNWEKYLKGINSQWYFIDTDSSQIEEIEIVGFENPLKNKPEKFIKIKRSAKMLFISSFVQDSLKEWDLKKCGLLKSKSVTKNTIIIGYRPIK
jgi:hypothetical protein